MIAAASSVDEVTGLKTTLRNLLNCWIGSDESIGSLGFCLL